MPYFALRYRSPSSNLPKHRRGIDMEFLDTAPISSKVGQHVLHEAQISFLICGSDEEDWTAYFLEDTYFEDQDEVEEDETEKDDCAVGGCVSDKATFMPDLIASGTLDSNRPIWSPREYFLRIIEIRIGQVVLEWSNLFSMVETKVEAMICSLHISMAS